MKKLSNDFTVRNIGPMRSSKSMRAFVMKGAYSMHPREFLKRHSLVIGILLMFALTWPIDLANSRVIPVEVPFAVYILLGYGIFFAALIMTAFTLGRDAVGTLLKRLLIWRVSVKWYLVALLLVPATMLAGVVLNAMLSGQPIDFSTAAAFKIFGPSANLLTLVLPYLLFDAITNGEEMGWRGYVLPRLQAKHSALVSSLILGIIWGLWHLPKFMGPGSTGSFALLMVATVARAVFLTWLYNNTGGSLLLTVLAHASWNTASVMLPLANTVSSANMSASIISQSLLIFAVLMIIAWEGWARLSRAGEMQVQVEASSSRRALGPAPAE